MEAIISMGQRIAGGIVGHLLVIDGLRNLDYNQLHRNNQD